MECRFECLHLWRTKYAKSSITILTDHNNRLSVRCDKDKFSNTLPFVCLEFECHCLKHVCREVGPRYLNFPHQSISGCIHCFCIMVASSTKIIICYHYATVTI